MLALFIFGIVFLCAAYTALSEPKFSKKASGIIALLCALSSAYIYGADPFGVIFQTESSNCRAGDFSCIFCRSYQDSSWHCDPRSSSPTIQRGRSGIKLEFACVAGSIRVGLTATNILNFGPNLQPSLTIGNISYHVTTFTRQPDNYAYYFIDRGIPMNQFVNTIRSNPHSSVDLLVFIDNKFDVRLFGRAMEILNLVDRCIRTSWD